MSNARYYVFEGNHSNGFFRDINELNEVELSCSGYNVANGNVTAPFIEDTKNDRYSWHSFDTENSWISIKFKNISQILLTRALASRIMRAITQSLGGFYENHFHGCRQHRIFQKRTRRHHAVRLLS